jgi:molecular chaperone GrpE
MSDDTKSVAGTPDGPEAGVESSPSETSEVTVLRDQLRIKEEEARAAHDRFLRQSAEMENFKKRVLREKEDVIKYANEALVKDLLSSVDNLERAIEHARVAGQNQSLVTGVEMILKGLLETLGKYGVAQVSTVGQQFNPEFHEAVAQVDSDSGDSNIILMEHQKGYLLKDRLLRPALVTVNRGAKSTGKENPDGTVENTPTDD